MTRGQELPEKSEWFSFW